MCVCVCTNDPISCYIILSLALHDIPIIPTSISSAAPLAPALSVLSSQCWHLQVATSSLAPQADDSW